MTDNVNRPSHYTNGNIECIDIIAEMVRDKSGIESVKKAQWYINRLIQELENGQ